MLENIELLKEGITSLPQIGVCAIEHLLSTKCEIPSDFAILFLLRKCGEVDIISRILVSTYDIVGGWFFCLYKM